MPFKDINKAKEYRKEYRLRNIRSRFHKVLDNYLKDNKLPICTNQYGIRYDKIVEHLKPFPKDISKYHVDHIRPLISFNFVDENGKIDKEEIKKAFSPENHQWLTIEEKSSKWLDNE